MKRIYCSKETNAVEMIFDLDKEPHLKDEVGPYTYLYHYMVDFEGKEEITYGHKYDKKEEKFKINPSYKEIPVYFEANGVEYKTPKEARVAFNLGKIKGASSQQVDALVKENGELRSELSKIKEYLGL